MRKFPTVFLTWILLAVTPASVSALAEIMSCNFASAIPRSGFYNYVGSALRMNRIVDNPLNDARDPHEIVLGGALSIRADKNLELSGWIYGTNNSMAYKFQTKVLCWNNDNNYLSVAPGYVWSEGKEDYSNSVRVERCSSNGFELPVIYTIDSERNVLLNLSANINCQWVKVWGSSEYKIHYYEYFSRPAIIGTLDGSVVAYSGIFSFIPELGITVFKDGGEKRKIVNWGMGIGVRW